MVAWVVKNVGGEIPRQDPRLLPDNMAEMAVNVDLNSGSWDGLPQPEFVVDLSGAPFPVRRAFRIPARAGNPDLWLPLPSEFSSVCQSPLANDGLHRFYWTTPQGYPGAGAWWNTYDRIHAGNVGANAPWNLGFIFPNPAIVLSVSASGGDASVPPIVRSYCFTYIDIYNLESSPSTPSTPLEALSDGTWTVTGLPTAAPANPAGMNYPPVAHMRLYRTVTGSTTGAQFYVVADVAFGSTTYVDTTPDTGIVSNNLLESTSWLSPPADLDGLISMPGGMMVGFTGNTVHFCEPNRPHAWPAGYDQSMLYPIVALTIWQQSLIVLTQGFPSTGSGASPAAYTFAQVQVPEPCISRGSVVNDLAGVYYASQNGLVMLNYYGMQNQTLSNMTKNIWLEDFRAEDIIACRHRTQYLAINGTGTGFMIDYAEQRLGIAHLTPFMDVISIWNDPYSGDAYVCTAQNTVCLWDSPNAPSMTWVWRSKQFYLPLPVSLGACQISLDSSVIDEPLHPPMPSPPGHTVPLFALPAGVRALFRLFAGPEGQTMVHEQQLWGPRMIFRLPSGRKAFCWQFELMSRVPIHSVELASTMKELRKV